MRYLRDHEYVEQNQSCRNGKYQALHKFLLVFGKLRGDTGTVWSEEKQSHARAQMSGICNK
jgi:hypothetical protein